MDPDDPPDLTVARWNAPTSPLRPGGPVVTAPADSATSVFDPPRARFEEHAELGRGGMGRVVEAVDRALDRPVAIKHSLASHPRDLARFEREVRITARLQHPGVVAILDAGRDADGQPFYVMRKIDGEPLNVRVALAGTVAGRLALVPAVIGAVDAAAYAHAQGVVHRDIKPSNILLGPFGETLLIDWGLARELARPDVEPGGAITRGPPASELTQIGKAYGTPGYLAPEQARGEPADRRADVYALGATLYYVLVGAPPIAGDPTVAIAKAAAGEQPDLARIPSEVPVELAAIVAKALAPQLAARYADAGELAADLRRFLAGQLVAAHAYTARERIARWVRRHRIATLVAAGALATILVVVALSFSRIAAERDQAREARLLAEARSEDMLVDRARSLVRIDPTSSVALLRALPAGSPAWPVAREIVRAAVAAGVERAITVHLGDVQSIAVAGDGRIATSAADRTVQLHDLATGTSRVVARFVAWNMEWFDDHTLAYWSTAPEVGLLDVNTGARRVLVTPGEVAHVAMCEGRVVVLGTTGTATMFGADARPTVLGTDFTAVDARDGRVAAIGPTRLVAIDGAGTRSERAVAIPLVREVKIAPGGERVAAVAYDAILEWTVAGDAPPRRWPRVTNHPNRIAYAGGTLYTWSVDRVFALASDEPVLRWQPRGEVQLIAPFRDGAVIATKEGRLAYIDELGTVELTHRSVQVATIATDRDGTRLIVGTRTGEVLIVDLAAVRPRRFAAGPAAELLAASTDELIVGDSHTTALGNSGETTLETIDATTLERRSLGLIGYGGQIMTTGDAIVGSAAGEYDRVVVWDLAGHERFRSEGARTINVGPGIAGTESVFFVTPAGDVMEYTLAPVQGLHTLGHFPPAPGAAHPPIVNLTATRSGLIAQIVNKQPLGKRDVMFDRDGQHELAIGILASWTVIGGRASDGALWAVADFEHVWRAPIDRPPVRVPLDEPIRMVSIHGDQVWAQSDAQLYVLGLDGKLVRSVSLAGAAKQPIRDAFVEQLADQLSITSGANVRRVLPLPAGAAGFVASNDGRLIAAVVKPPEVRPLIVMWRDPVPLDPAAVPAYLERITNGWLAFGSDGLTWGARP